MSEVEIRYEVPEESRELGDLEELLNAIGAYQEETPFSIIQEVKIAEDKEGTALVSLVRLSLFESGLAYELRGDVDGMRSGVEEHFPEESKERLAKLFVGSTGLDTSETPQS